MEKKKKIYAFGTYCVAVIFAAGAVWLSVSQDNRYELGTGELALLATLISLISALAVTAVNGGIQLQLGKAVRGADLSGEARGNMDDHDTIAKHGWSFLFAGKNGMLLFLLTFFGCLLFFSGAQSPLIKKNLAVVLGLPERNVDALKAIDLQNAPSKTPTLVSVTPEPTVRHPTTPAELERDRRIIAVQNYMDQIESAIDSLAQENLKQAGSVRQAFLDLNKVVQELQRVTDSAPQQITRDFDKRIKEVQALVDSTHKALALDMEKDLVKRSLDDAQYASDALQAEKVEPAKPNSVDYKERTVLAALSMTSSPTRPPENPSDIRAYFAAREADALNYKKHQLDTLWKTLNLDSPPSPPADWDGQKSSPPPGGQKSLKGEATKTSESQSAPRTKASLSPHANKLSITYSVSQVRALQALHHAVDQLKWQLKLGSSGLSESATPAKQGNAPKVYGKNALFITESQLSPEQMQRVNWDAPMTLTIRLNKIDKSMQGWISMRVHLVHPDAVEHITSRKEELSFIAVPSPDEVKVLRDLLGNLWPENSQLVNIHPLDGPFRAPDQRTAARLTGAMQLDLTYLPRARTVTD